MSPRIGPSKFGQNYPSTPAYSQTVVQPSNAAEASIPEMAVSAKSIQPSEKKADWHLYATAPIQATASHWKDEQRYKKEAAQGEALIAQLNKHQHDDQFVMNKTTPTQVEQNQPGQNGFSRNSSPMVVDRPWPGMTTVPSSNT
jgi:hypothetical protein